jgi:hypothetical protein
MEKSCTFTTTTTITHETADTVSSASLVAVSEALARQLELEYLDEYLARQMQHTMDNFQDNNNNNNKDIVFSNKAMMSLLDDLKPDVEDCQIYLSDDNNDDDDDDDEQKSNKEDSKLPPIVALRRGRAICGAPQDQQQQQQQQHQSASFKNDTFSNSPPVARRIVVAPSSSSSSSLIPSPSCSSLQRALRHLEYGDTAHAAARKPSSLQRAILLGKRHRGGSNFAAAGGFPDDDDDDDYSALCLQQGLMYKTNDDDKDNDAAVAASEALAQQLQQELDREELLERQQLCHEAETLMHTSVTGRAWKFVEQVLALHEQYKQSGMLESNVIVPLATDDMVFWTEKLIQKQDSFRAKNRPTTVSLGFHFTNPTNLSQIRTNGLLTKQERQDRNINSTFNGSVYGDGVYTAEDVTVGSSGRYGDIGIICACLNGKEKMGGRNFDPPGDDGGGGDDDQDFSSLSRVLEWLF